MFISSLIPASHRHLRMLRLFFPGVTASDRPIRWSELVPEGEELRFNDDWYELVEAARNIGRLTEAAEPAEGRLEPDTVSILTAALRMSGGSETFHALYWPGYYGELPDGCGEETAFADLPYFTPHPEASKIDPDLTCCETTITTANLRPERYPPSFLWDDNAQLAWGSFMYPESLFIAAAPNIFTMIHQNPLADAASIPRPNTETPPSGG